MGNMKIRPKKKKIKNKYRNRDAMDTTEEPVSDRPQAMDTSESGAPNQASGGQKLKVKGRQMKRSKNVRKAKSVAKGISKNEQSIEKALKLDSKKSRTQSAKLLYE